MKSQTHTNLIIRSIIALALTMVIWLPVQALSAESADETMMNHTYGWMYVGLDSCRHLGGGPAGCHYHQAVQKIIVRSRSACEVNC
jgi:hypothetical protein